MVCKSGHIPFLITEGKRSEAASIQAIPAACAQGSTRTIEQMGESLGVKGITRSHGEQNDKKAIMAGTVESYKFANC